MAWDLTDLPWLAPPPDDLKARLASLSGEAGVELRALANTALSTAQQLRVSRSLRKLRAEGRLAPLSPLRLGVLSNATFKPLLPAIEVAGARHGVDLQVEVGPYDQAVQTAQDPEAAVHRCEALLIALHHAGLGLGPHLDPDKAQMAVDRALARVEAILAGVHAHGDGIALVQTVPRPNGALFGSLDRCTPGSLRWQVERFDAGLRDLLAGSADRLFDVAGLAESVGLFHWHDPAK